MTTAESARSAPAEAPRRPEALNLLLLGASPQSLNRGVAALGTACIDNLLRALPEARLVVAAGGLASESSVELPDRRVTTEISWLTGRNSWRQRSAAQHLRWIRRLRYVLPGLGTRWLVNRTFRQLNDCDAVLDLSGGDSFADTYTGGVFALQVAVKQLALEMGKPLILLPQTIGPFRDQRSQRIARGILERCALVATRDARGLDSLRSMMNDRMPARVLSCPDIAFTLRPMPVPENERRRLTAGQGPLIGLNVSGLLWDSNVDFGLQSNYRALIDKLVSWAMDQPDARLLLVPHVFNNRQQGRRGALQEDAELEVCAELAAEARSRWGARVQAIAEPYSAAQLKTIIGACDFFIGARMHACIAAVSQGVPTAILAYSKKAEGVMGLIGSDGQPPIPIVDLREWHADRCLIAIDQAYRERAAIRARLESAMQRAQQQVRDFFSHTLVETLVSRETARAPGTAGAGDRHPAASG